MFHHHLCLFSFPLPVSFLWILFDICSVDWRYCLYSVFEPFAEGSGFLWSCVNKGGVTKQGGRAYQVRKCLLIGRDQRVGPLSAAALLIK